MKVRIDGNFTVTTFDDSIELCTPHFLITDGQEETARDVWYKDAKELNRDHDVTHHLLAKLLGLAYSPALYKAAHDEANPDAWIEEAAVLAIQRFANQQGISLIEVAVACGLLRSREQ
jgi:hypothetical protein